MQVPLFPLNTVLFPGGPLPLRIFESRYLEMVSDCLRNDAPFGVLLIREGGEIGTATRVATGCSVSRRLANSDFVSSPVIAFRADSTSAR